MQFTYPCLFHKSSPKWISGDLIASILFDWKLQIGHGRWFHLFTSKIQLVNLPTDYDTFLYKFDKRIWCYIRIIRLAGKLVFSHNLSTRFQIGIIRRIYMLTTSWRWMHWNWDLEFPGPNHSLWRSTSYMHVNSRLVCLSD